MQEERTGREKTVMLKWRDGESKERRRGGDMTAGRREDGRGKRATTTRWPSLSSFWCPAGITGSCHFTVLLPQQSHGLREIICSYAEDESDNSYQPMYDGDNSVNTNVKSGYWSTLHATQVSLSSVRRSCCPLISINCKGLNESASILWAGSPLVSE